MPKKLKPVSLKPKRLCQCSACQEERAMQQIQEKLDQLGWHHGDYPCDCPPESKTILCPTRRPRRDFLEAKCRECGRTVYFPPFAPEGIGKTCIVCALHPGEQSLSA